MKAFVDPDLCIGCELCAGIVPDVFSMDGAIAVAIEEGYDPSLESDVQSSVEDCPVEAISVK